MRTQINPVVALIIVVVVLLGVGAVVWQKTAGRAPGSGRMESLGDPNKMEKDPVKIMEELKALKDKEDAQRSKR